MSATRCESCTMPIESGPYCPHCSDGEGRLHPFDEIFARFEQWTRGREPGLGDEEVRRKVLAFMAGTPAWRDHPAVRGA